MILNLSFAKLFLIRMQHMFRTFQSSSGSHLTFEFWTSVILGLVSMIVSLELIVREDFQLSISVYVYIYFFSLCVCVLTYVYIRPVYTYTRTHIYFLGVSSWCNG